MSDEFDGQYETFRALLESFPPAEAVKRLQQFGIGQDVIERIRSRHEQYSKDIREMTEPRSVVMLNHETWYTGPQAGDKCWPALERLLARGMSDKAIGSLDDSSSKIVSLLNHPRERAFSSRGLVVGYVQSGKTTNFTSVMAKAADRGYKLFIVLAGIHNGLRRQTQARLVRQLVEPNPTLWSQLTGLDQDFTPQANPASYFGRSNRTRILCVVKKNKTVLGKLARWLAEASDHLQDCPALIIDDEADQASVATKSINPLILEIINTLPKAAYVGYTASPFANLLIDPAAKDLYPQNFVVNLPKPAEEDGYFGTEVLFGREPVDGEDPEDAPVGLPMIRSVPQEDVERVRPLKASDVEGFVPEITDTLRDAVHYFWLVTAARRVRGTGNPHNTMLIHTSVNTVVHNSFRQPLEALRERLRSSVGDTRTWEELKALWDRETEAVPAENFGERTVPFNELLQELPGVLDDCRIIMDNSDSEDRLDYENGPVVAIAVGGNTLSRGLTLEGLSVSYFVRAASAYDTLLQMGRWFGYRSGYPDLPRIWMTDELSGWFRDVATVEAEMRRDIEIYMTEDKTPLTFAVRLRTHPALRVTAAAKMTNAVPAASAYGGHRVQTRYFAKDAEWLSSNQKAAKKLVAAAKAQALRQESRPDDGRYLFRNVPHEDVLEFLREYRFHERSQEGDSQLLIEYIKKRVRVADSLRSWNIAIIGNPRGSNQDTFRFAEDVEVERVVRSALPTGAAEYVDIKTLMSPRDALVDITVPPGRLFEADIKNERKRQLPDVGLLTLYPVRKDGKPKVRTGKNGERLGCERVALDLPLDAIGVGVVFPEPESKDSEVSYVSADLSRVPPQDLEQPDLGPLEGEA